jgi:N-acetylglucosamine-6-phosphate deacetylase
MESVSGRYKIMNGHIITENTIISNGTLLIEDGKILGVEKDHIESTDFIEIDAKGNYVSPGFIDIHVHGGGGFDFMDETEEAFLKAASLHARFGTTSLLATTLTADKEGILRTLDVYNRVHEKSSSGANFLGIHLEGPYFSLNQRGAQDPQYIRDPDPKEYMEILERSPYIKRWSIAPEKEGAIELGKFLSKEGIIPSMAHTDAVYDEAKLAFENGFSLLTHFYSAMSGVVRKNAMRYAGVIEAGYLHDELDVEIIADGVHLPEALLKLIYKIKGADHIALITDAMRGAAMPNGIYKLGNAVNGMDVKVEGNVAKLIDGSAFAGSTATANRLIKTMINIAEVPLIDAIKMISTTPARIMKINQHTGSIKKGMDADLVIFDKSIEINRTISKGSTIFTSEN